MRKVIQNFLSAVYRAAIRLPKIILNVLRLFLHREYWDKKQTYYPEYKDKQKTTIVIIWEQITYIARYLTPNKFYFLYGFDIKGLRYQEEYVDAFNVFSVVRNKLNQSFLSPYVVLRDKSLFGIVAEAYGILTPKNLGIIQNGLLYLFGKKQTITIAQLVNMEQFEYEGCKDLFIKKIDGECADGVYHVVIKNGSMLYKGEPLKIDSFFEKDKRYLVQEAIKNQHYAISAFHPNSVNTIRLCTAYNKKTAEVEVVSCVLRVGVGDNNVDNWAAGGLSIGVDTDKGTLRKYGFYKPGFGTKAIEHPDSHIIFDGYTIPYIQEAINQARVFHGHLYGLHSVGWDIAITDEGPCFVEGNDNWEISLMQISNHGLKKEFDHLFC